MRRVLICVLVFCFLSFAVSSHGMLTDQQVWDCLCTTAELGGTTSQAMQDSRGADALGVMHYSRMWSGGLGGRGCNIVLRIFKTDADAKKFVEDYGKSAKAKRVNIGDSGFTTQNVAPTRPFYRVYRGRYALSMSMHYFRRATVEDLKPYLRMMVGRIDKLPKQDVHAITITSGPSGSPNPVRSGGVVTCQVSAKDNGVGHKLNYTWMEKNVAGKFGSASLPVTVWTAPSNNTARVAEYEISATVQCDKLGSVGRVFKVHVIPAGSEVEFKLLPKADPRILAPGTNVTYQAQAVCNLGHKPVTYEWTCAGGSFKDKTLPNPVWLAPKGPIKGTQSFKITCKATCSGGASKSASITQQVGEQLVLTVNTDTNKIYITSDTLQFDGSLTFASQPVDGADIQIKMTTQLGKDVPCAGAVTKGGGKFSFAYKIDPLDMEDVQKLGGWSVVIKAIPADPAKGAVSQPLILNVAPVNLKLHSFKLVQVVELPERGGGLALDKEAGARLVVSCPSLKGLNVPKPKVKMELDIGTGPKSLSIKGYPIVKEVEIGPDEVAVDFVGSDMTLTEQEGSFGVSIKVDSDEIYTIPTKVNDLINTKGVTVKKMKKMSVVFTPVDLDVSTASMKSKFSTFVGQQSGFMKEVYPLPDNYWGFKTSYRIGKLVELERMKSVSAFLTSRFGPAVINQIITMQALSTYSFLVADKCVGVLPFTTGLLSPLQAGSMTGIATRGVLVKHGSKRGVTAHEIGHTVGLNKRFSGGEEYFAVPDNGREVAKELFMKGGKIYDSSDKKDITKAFGRGVNCMLCFMGRSETSAGYKMRHWVCPETRNDLYHALKDPPGRTVMAMGVIDKSDNVHLFNWYVRDGEPDLAEKGDYAIECLDSSGAVLNSSGFGKKGMDGVHFAFVIPYPAKTDHIVIRDQKKILKTVRPSASEPKVEVLSPNGGESVGDKLTVSWKASDVDGDKLYASVLFSRDKGESWDVLTAESTSTVYAADISNMAGGKECLVKIAVTDGFNTSYDESDAVFTVANRPPLVSIEGLTNGMQVELGAEITLKAAAWDFEAGELLVADNISWDSDKGGALGKGGEIKVKFDKEGDQKITASVADNDGVTGAASISVKVVKGAEKVVLKRWKDFSVTTESVAQKEVFIGADGKAADADIRLKYMSGSVGMYFEGRWFHAGRLGMITAGHGKLFKLEDIREKGGKLVWTFSHSLKPGMESGFYQQTGGMWRKTHVLVVE